MRQPENATIHQLGEFPGRALQLHLKHANHFSFNRFFRPAVGGGTGKLSRRKRTCFQCASQYPVHREPNFWQAPIYCHRHEPGAQGSYSSNRQHDSTHNPTTRGHIGEHCQSSRHIRENFRVDHFRKDEHFRHACRVDQCFDHSRHVGSLRDGDSTRHGARRLLGHATGRRAGAANHRG